jgi:hypothetical protein
VGGGAPNGAGHVPAGEPESAELVVWHEYLDQRKELPLLKPDVCVKQFPRRIQRLSFDDAGRNGDVEFTREPLELHVLEACLAKESRLRLDVPEEKREELFFLIPKVDTLFVPEELHEPPGRPPAEPKRLRPRQHGSIASSDGGMSVSRFSMRRTSGSSPAAAATRSMLKTGDVLETSHAHEFLLSLRMSLNVRQQRRCLRSSRLRITLERQMDSRGV